MGTGSVTSIKVIGGEIKAYARLSGDVDVIATLDMLRLRAQDMRPVLDKFGAYLVNEHIPRNFRLSGSPKRWAALSTQYAKWKLAHYGRLPKLVLTRKMQSGFTWQAKARSLVIRNTRKWWTAHQYGVPERNLPARPMLYLVKRDHDQLIQLARDYMSMRGVDARTGTRLG